MQSSFSWHMQHSRFKWQCLSLCLFDNPAIQQQFCCNKNGLSVKRRLITVLYEMKLTLTNCAFGDIKRRWKKKVKIKKLLYILFPILSTLQKYLKQFMLSLELSIVIILYRGVSTDCIMFTTGLSWMTYWEALTVLGNKCHQLVR